jgi:hypothetical protein
MSRWLRFIILMLVGLAGGLAYGWVINPIEYVNTAPATLRIDYKTDYVLMTAETYHSEGDLSLAVRRLALLGNLPPDQTVHQSILFAERAGYTDADLALIHTLYDALQTYTSGLSTLSP